MLANFPIGIILTLRFKIRLILKCLSVYILILVYPFLSPLIQYSDEDETNCVTQGDKLRALKSRRQAKAPTASPLT